MKTIINAGVRAVAAFALATTLGSSSPALAQFADEAEEQSLTAPRLPGPVILPDVQLPATLPGIRPFDDMTGFKSDGQTSMSFALDPMSFSTGEHHAQIVVSARSATGVVNTAYYAFDCERLSYTMLAYVGSRQQWRATRLPLRWREVRDGETRNRQYRAVFGAACKQGGTPTPSKRELLTRLRDPDSWLYQAP